MGTILFIWWVRRRNRREREEAKAGGEGGRGADSPSSPSQKGRTDHLEQMPEVNWADMPPRANRHDRGLFVREREREGVSGAGGETYIDGGLQHRSFEGTWRG